jgi:hypothetical protein
MLGLALNLRTRRIACPALVLVFCVGCSSGLDNRQGSGVGAGQKTKRGQSKPRFRNPEMDATYKAAKASPRSFDPVYAYAKAVTDACLASLVDPSCNACAEGAVRYKQRSEIEPHYWPIIDEALSMIEALGKVPGLTAEQMDPLVATKGRLLWLAGRSVEEHPLIDEYAQAHPDAAAVIRRRIELLHEAGDAAAIESQCARSRTKTESAPEAARADLLTACVAFHPGNKNGRSDLLDYAKYLPNLSTAEEAVYRTNLVQRCEERVGDVEERCGQACACVDKDSGKQPTAKCKQACVGCHNEMAQKLRLCKKISEAPSAVVRAPQPKTAPAPSGSPPRRLPPAKFLPDDDTPRPKRDTGKGLKPMEL